MTAKPTAVVVRLPLSEEQKRKAVAEMMFAGVPVSDAFVKAINAIGTPVAGGELEMVGYAHCVNGKIVTLGTYRAPDVSDGISVTSEPLVRQAAVAAAQAEIGRDSERLDWFEENCSGAKSQWNEKQSLVEWQIKDGEWFPNLRMAIDAAREGE